MSFTHLCHIRCAMNVSCALENLGTTNSSELVNSLRKIHVINRSEQNFVS